MADMDPGAYLPKWSLYAPGLIEMAYFDSKLQKARNRCEGKQAK